MIRGVVSGTRDPARVVRGASRAVVIAAASVGVVLASMGCGGSTDGADRGRSAAVDRETFIEVYIALRRAADEAEDSAAFAERRRGILERHGIDAVDLERFVDQRRDDVRELSLLWDTIERRMSAPPDTADPGRSDADGSTPRSSTESDPVEARDVDDAAHDRNRSIPSMPRPRG